MLERCVKMCVCVRTTTPTSQQHRWEDWEYLNKINKSRAPPILRRGCCCCWLWLLRIFYCVDWSPIERDCFTTSWNDPYSHEWLSLAHCPIQIGLQLPRLVCLLSFVARLDWFHIHIPFRFASYLDTRCDCVTIIAQFCFSFSPLTRRPKLLSLCNIFRASAAQLSAVLGAFCFDNQCEKWRTGIQFIIHSPMLFSHRSFIDF